MNRLRNRVSHRGSSSERRGEYAGCIATVAFPFLDKFLGEDPHKLSLKNAVMPDIYRELDVALKVCERLRQESLTVGPYVLYTAGLAMRHAWVDWPRREEGPSADEEYDLAQQTGNDLPAAWDDEVIENHHCAICGGVNLFVHVRHVAGPERRLIPLAARCPNCGLDIHDEDKYLAEFHVIDFPPEVVDDHF